MTALLSVLSLERPAAAEPSATPAAAATAHPSTPTPAAAAHSVIPDYGGRNGSLGSALDGGAAAPLNPLAQAGRALEALVIVLVVVAGGLMLLKRSGLLKADGTFAAKGGPGFWSSLIPKPAAGGTENVGTEGALELLTLLGSQTLPNSSGACLHLISVGSRVLLLGATGQSVTMLTEVADFAPTVESDRETPEDAAAFEEYLTRVGVTSPATNGAAVTQATLSAATSRLQSLVNRQAK